LKLKLDFPPNSSILNSALYEGYLFVSAKCKDAEGVELEWECVEKLLKEVGESKGWKEVRFYLVGNDVKATVKKLCGSVDITDIRGLTLCLSGKPVKSMEVGQRISESKELLVGDASFLNSPRRRGRKGKGEGTAESVVGEGEGGRGGGSGSGVGGGYAFQIMKVDRYQGISVLESNLVREQVTVYADLAAVDLFFLGVASAYVTSVGTEYYLLFFSEETLPQAMKSPRMWLSIKDSLANSLSNVIQRAGGVQDEILTLSSILNYAAVQEMWKWNVMEANLRLVKVVGERNTYKVYEEIPIQVFSNREIYSDEKFLVRLQNLVSFLLTPASAYLRGRDTLGDGYHAYQALRYLYAYVVTGNGEYLAKALREVHEAHRANERRGYLGWVTSRLITRSSRT
jgi:hypothetical protein